LDALFIINFLNARFPTAVSPTAATGGGPGFLDTTGNDEVAPLDALLVINALNAGLAGEGESIESAASDSNELMPYDVVLTQLLLGFSFETSPLRERADVTAR